MFLQVLYELEEKAELILDERGVCFCFIVIFELVIVVVLCWLISKVSEKQASHAHMVNTSYK